MDPITDHPFDDVWSIPDNEEFDQNDRSDDGQVNIKLVDSPIVLGRMTSKKRTASRSLWGEADDLQPPPKKPRCDTPDGSLNGWDADRYVRMDIRGSDEKRTTKTDKFLKIYVLAILGLSVIFVLFVIGINSIPTQANINIRAVHDNTESSGCLLPECQDVPFLRNNKEISIRKFNRTRNRLISNP